MNQGTDPTTLALRDIHLPESVLWWPPAPGWWILIFLVLIVSSLIYLLIRKKNRHRLSAIYLAKQELKRIEDDYNSNNDKSFLIKEVSELIRRVSISLFNRNDVASLTGKNWLFFLDELNGDTAFSNGIGKVLIEAPYQAHANFNEKELLDLVSTWLDSAKNKATSKRSQK
jgi:uncharacterized protein DUF4381